MVSSWMDAYMGIFCNIYKLYLRYDPFYGYQPEGHKSKRVLEILFRVILCSTIFCVSSYYENDVAAKRCDQCAFTKPWMAGSRNGASVLNRSDMGESNGYCHQHLGWRALYIAAAYGSVTEYSGRAL